MKRISSLLLLCVVLGLSTVALAGGETDIAAFRDRQRKAKSLGERAEVAFDFTLVLSRHARQDMNLEIYKGIKEMLNEGAADLKKLQTEKGKEDPEVVRLLAKLNATMTTIQGDVDYVKANKLDSVKMPEDVYAGADREKIKAAVNQAWKERYPTDKVMKVLLPKTEWERKKTEEKVGSEWKKYDISSMVVKVLVDKDDERATIHTIYIQVNHHQSEAYEVGRKGAGFDPMDIAKKNVR